VRGTSSFNGSCLTDTLDLAGEPRAGIDLTPLETDKIAMCA
jgi:hypothetical protein